MPPAETERPERIRAQTRKQAAALHTLTRALGSFCLVAAPLPRGLSSSGQTWQQGKSSVEAAHLLL